jgi:hypothetical protein
MFRQLFAFGHLVALVALCQGLPRIEVDLGAPASASVWEVTNGNGTVLVDYCC